ncbi:MAG: 50S ribosomal protein L23 [Deltaproteobacteria bacterium]|nr:50S ribosomal protein L23 [Deltaproteobacteria bacterium]
MEAYGIIRRIIMTEKSTLLREACGQYVFEVVAQANKVEVSRAIELLFKVKVDSVRLLNVRGKRVRIAKFGGRLHGRKRSWKKAIVKLSPGSKIEVMEGL